MELKPIPTPTLILEGEALTSDSQKTIQFLIGRNLFASDQVMAGEESFNNTPGSINLPQAYPHKREDELVGWRRCLSGHELE